MSMLQQLVLSAMLVLAMATSSNSSAPEECCGSMTGGQCADGTAGTPCCGVGGCNIFCCNCDGGCRQPKPAPTPSPPVPPPASATPLIQWPMITTHDSATCYYGDTTCSLVHMVNNYVMTQCPGTFTKQLNCGARAFDVRLYVDGSQLKVHHGGVKIDHLVSDSLNEIKAWAAQHPTELIVVYGSHCAGDSGCTQKFSEVLSAAGVAELQCSDVAGLTLGTAMTRGKLSSGGSVLAVMGCVQDNWVESISCYGDLEKDKALEPQLKKTSKLGTKEPRDDSYTCYGSQSSKAFDPLWDYMTKTCDGRGKSQGNFWMAQAHWQYSASSIAQGELHTSCILQDEAKAHVNRQTAEKISAGLFPHINMLEVDNVCGGDGPQLLQALRSRFTYDMEDYLKAQAETITV